MSRDISLRDFCGQTSLNCPACLRTGQRARPAGLDVGLARCTTNSHPRQTLIKVISLTHPHVMWHFVNWFWQKHVTWHCIAWFGQEHVTWCLVTWFWWEYVTWHFVAWFWRNMSCEIALPDFSGNMSHDLALHNFGGNMTHEIALRDFEWSHDMFPPKSRNTMSCDICLPK